MRKVVKAAAVGRGQGPAVMEESCVTRRRRVQVEARRPDLGRRPATRFRHRARDAQRFCFRIFDQVEIIRLTLNRTIVSFNPLLS